MHRINQEVAGRLEEVAGLLRDQGADRFRVRAFLRAAAAVRSMPDAIDEVYRARGLDGLKEVRYIGETIARAIRELLTHGRLPMLDRLRGEGDAVALLVSVPGIGRIFAERLHEELGLETLADLEAAAHDGRLETVAGFGHKRLAGIRDSRAHRLGRVATPRRPGTPPSVAELLDSMDFLNFVLALHDRLGIDIPEADYPRLSTLDGAVAYLASRTRDPATESPGAEDHAH